MWNSWEFIVDHVGAGMSARYFGMVKSFQLVIETVGKGKVIFWALIPTRLPEMIQAVAYSLSPHKRDLIHTIRPNVAAVKSIHHISHRSSIIKKFQQTIPLHHTTTPQHTHFSLWPVSSKPLCMCFPQRPKINNLLSVNIANILNHARQHSLATEFGVITLALARQCLCLLDSCLELLRRPCNGSWVEVGDVIGVCVFVPLIAYIGGGGARDEVDAVAGDAQIREDGDCFGESWLVVVFGAVDFVPDFVEGGGGFWVNWHG